MGPAASEIGIVSQTGARLASQDSWARSIPSQKRLHGDGFMRDNPFALKDGPGCFRDRNRFADRREAGLAGLLGQVDSQPKTVAWRRLHERQSFRVKRWARLLPRSESFRRPARGWPRRPPGPGRFPAKNGCMETAS